MHAVLAAGLLLGLVSRIEEITPGFSLGISSDSAWVGAAFLAGTPLRGAAALTAANAGYYAWVAGVERVPLEAAAGPVAPWLLLGLAGGTAFGAFGWAWRNGRRLLAVLPLAAVLITEGVDGHWTGGAGLLLGLALPVASAPGPRAALASAALLAAALAGWTQPLLP